MIWGASSHARVVADVVRSRGEFEIVGYLDDVNPGRRGESFNGSLILGGRDQLEVLRGQGVRALFIGIGDCAKRLELSEMVREQGFSRPVLVHPGAIIAADVVIGPGTLVAAAAVVNPAAVVGEDVIINTAATIDHECVIQAGVHVSAGVHLGGKVLVERGARIEIGAVVGAGLRIGADSIIGAGSVVLRDVPSGVLAYGSPAVVRRRLD